MELIQAKPRGFCAGVVRAIEIVELALDVCEAPIYVYHEIVHNRHVVADLEKRGAIFVESLSDIPAGSVTIFSAHGVPQSVVSEANERELDVIDATCPLVTKVHLQARSFSGEGYSVIIVGHVGHQEVEGTLGAIKGPSYVLSTLEEVEQLELDNPDKVAYVTQTTLSIDDTREVIEALKERYPNIQGPGLDDICYATQNRQNAVHELAQQVDLMLVVGSSNSSNSNRLREVGEQCGVTSYLIENESQIKEEWLAKGIKIGLTAGASAPEVLVEEVIDRLKRSGVDKVSTMNGVEESAVFKIPKKLIDAKEILVESQPAAS